MLRAGDDDSAPEDACSVIDYAEGDGATGVGEDGGIASGEPSAGDLATA